MKNRIELNIPSSLENIATVRAIIRTYLEKQSVIEEEILKIISIVDELMTNAVEHGYLYGAGQIRIEVQLENDEILIVVDDCGMGFDETKKSKEDGGLGLILVKSMSDSFCIEKRVEGTRIKVSRKIKEGNSYGK